MKYLFYIFILLIFPLLTFGAQKTSVTYGSTVSGTNWTNAVADTLNASDDRYAKYAVATSDYLIITNFGFSIPTDSLIDSVIVSVEGQSNGNTTIQRGFVIGITKDASTISTNTSSWFWEKDTDVVRTFGAKGTWGETLSPSDVNSSNFGVIFYKSGADTKTNWVDLVSVTIIYSDADNIAVTIDGATDTDDGYTDGNNQSTARGGETWFHVMCGFSDCTYYGLLKFDLSDISGTIDSVNLYMHRKEPDNDFQLYFHRITTDWIEYEFTWDSAKTDPGGVAWTTGGGDYNATKADSLTNKGAAAYNETIYCQRGNGVGLADLIQDWIDGTYSNYGMIIKSQLLGVGDTVYIYSADNYDEDLYPRPKLYVEYTPAAGGEVSARRRKVIIQ